MAIFSFGGVENVSVAAAESENPARDVPRAAKAMIIRLVLFYVLAIAVVVTLRPWTVSASSAGGVLESPFVSALEMANVPAAAGLMNFVLITAALSAANGCLFSSSRMLYSLSADRMAPRFLGWTSPNGAPRAAVLLASVGMILASLLALAFPDTAFQLLFGVLVFRLLTTWTLITATYIQFRRTRSRLGLSLAPKKLLGGPVTAAVVLVVCLGVFVALGFIPSLSIALPAGLPYLAVLLVAFWVVKRKVGRFHARVLDEELSRRAANTAPTG